MTKHVLKGNYPVLATAWKDDGQFDPDSQARLVDWLIDSGCHGLVMLANASEGHAQSDAERDRIFAFSMKRVAGRVPVIATVTHFAAEIAIEKARRAQDLGAACVMSMPQFFGTWGSDLPAVLSYYGMLASAITVPVMVQDHPVSGVAMSADFLARLASEIDNVSYFKLEFTQSPYKMARVLAQAGKAVAAMFGGESGIYLIEEYERGGRGTMPGCYMPRVFSETFRLLEAGKQDEAQRFFTPYLPIINLELRIANRNVSKCVLKELGILTSDRIRGPIPAYWDAVSQRQFMNHLRRVGLDTLGVRTKVRRRSVRAPGSGRTNVIAVK
jgi:2-keto-3-deoxy-L-arabinonate dehydratase